MSCAQECMGSLACPARSLLRSRRTQEPHNAGPHSLSKAPNVCHNQTTAVDKAQDVLAVAVVVLVGLFRPWNGTSFGVCR